MYSGRFNTLLSYDAKESESESDSEEEESEKVGRSLFLILEEYDPYDSSVTLPMAFISSSVFRLASSYWCWSLEWDSDLSGFFSFVVRLFR